MTTNTKKRSSYPRLHWHASRHTSNNEIIIELYVKFTKLCIPSFNEKWWQDYKGACNSKRCHGEIIVWIS